MKFSRAAVKTIPLAFDNTVGGLTPPPSYLHPTISLSFLHRFFHQPFSLFSIFQPSYFPAILTLTSLLPTTQSPPHVRAFPFLITQNENFVTGLKKSYEERKRQPWQPDKSLFMSFWKSFHRVKRLSKVEMLTTMEKRRYVRLYAKDLSEIQYVDLLFNSSYVKNQSAWHRIPYSA